MALIILILTLIVFAIYCFRQAMRLIKSPQYRRTAVVRQKRTFNELKRSVSDLCTIRHQPSNPTITSVHSALRIDSSVKPIGFDIVPDRTIDIDYCDATGKTTRRTITAQRIYSGHGGEFYIVGFCHLRNRMRSFRCDRIHAIYENNTRISLNYFLKTTGLYNNRDTKEAVAIQKIQDMVRNMPDTDLDEFIEK